MQNFVEWGMLIYFLHGNFHIAGSRYVPCYEGSFNQVIYSLCLPAFVSLVHLIRRFVNHIHIVQRLCGPFCVFYLLFSYKKVSMGIILKTTTLYFLSLRHSIQLKEKKGNACETLLHSRLHFYCSIKIKQVLLTSSHIEQTPNEMQI